MKLRTKYMLFMCILHLALLGLSYMNLRENMVIFILSEVLVIFSVLISIGLYRQLVEPLVYLKDGISAIKDKDFNVKFLLTGKEEADELIGVYNQMMDALRDERTRQEAQHFFLEKLIQTSPTGIIILDYDHRIHQVNPKAAAILGATADNFVDELRSLSPGASKVIKIGGLQTYKVHKSNFIDRGFPRVFVMMEELTVEIFEAEKNAYGKVIRMMAHEVNNTVGPVNSILNLALDTGALWQLETHAALKKAIRVAVERNQNLNLFMRNFADLVKLSPVNKIAVDLCSLIRSVASLMQVKADQLHMALELDLPTQPFYVMADALQFEQALINIVKNAIEAMEEGGTIRFLLDPAAKRLTITDNGKGIPPEFSEQLFTPFFSTKRDGQGIGLTLVREILVNHGFGISLQTIKPGQTEFVISM